MKLILYLPHQKIIIFSVFQMSSVCQTCKRLEFTCFKCQMYQRQLTFTQVTLFIQKEMNKRYENQKYQNMLNDDSQSEASEKHSSQSLRKSKIRIIGIKNVQQSQKNNQAEENSWTTIQSIDESRQLPPYKDTKQDDPLSKISYQNSFSQIAHSQKSKQKQGKKEIKQMIGASKEAIIDISTQKNLAHTQRANKYIFSGQGQLCKVSLPTAPTLSQTFDKMNKGSIRIGPVELQKINHHDSKPDFSKCIICDQSAVYHEDNLSLCVEHYSNGCQVEVSHYKK